VKPIVAQVNADCASAGYWVVSPADEIVVTPTGRVGSIGVMTCHDDISRALEEAGITRTVITSSPYKGEAFGPLSDEARAYMQEQVDAYDALFVNRVASGRGVSAAEVRANFGKGRMVMASLAVKAGMADRVGTMAETLARFGVNPVQPSAGPPERRFPAAREKRRLMLAN
jgi:ClpP class serine protease